MSSSTHFLCFPSRQNFVRFLSGFFNLLNRHLWFCDVNCDWRIAILTWEVTRATYLKHTHTHTHIRDSEIDFPLESKQRHNENEGHDSDTRHGDVSTVGAASPVVPARNPTNGRQVANKNSCILRVYVYQHKKYVWGEQRPPAFCRPIY